jgi:hypothetical protein
VQLLALRFNFTQFVIIVYKIIFEILTTVTPCSPLEVNRHRGGTYCLLLQDG